MKEHNIFHMFQYSILTGRMHRFLFGRFYKFLLRITTAYSWYPKEVRKIKPETIFFQENKFFLSKRKNKPSVKKEILFKFDALKLASVDVSAENEIDWWADFEDDEDLESLHRWNWLLYLLTESE